MKRTQSLRQRGNALVEFAIGASVMFFVFSGTFQYGYTFYRYNSLQNAVENGAHYAGVKTYDTAGCTPSDAFSAAVKNMVVYGDPTGTTTTPIVPGLTTSNVNLSVTTCNGGVPFAMTVYISGYTIDGLFGSTTLSNKPTVTFPYQGFYSPY